MIIIDRDKLRQYNIYHLAMTVIGDCDPAYPALEYIADRFELNIEQRYWLAFLYQATYCVPTVFYIYNEFPDYENVDVRRIEHWWKNNKHKLLFQTDRLKVKSFNKFVPMFESYRDIVGQSQQQFFNSYKEACPRQTYNKLYKACGKIYYMGRFSLFLYLESVHRLTAFPMVPTDLDLRNADSCRDGLCYALGLNTWVKSNLTAEQYLHLSTTLLTVVIDLQTLYPEVPTDIWSVETSLCAYNKLNKSKRYLGYYIDRLYMDIVKMEQSVKEGVDWSVFWDFRKEFFDKRWLGEFHTWEGVRKQQMGMPSKPLLKAALEQNCKRRVEWK